MGHDGKSEFHSKRTHARRQRNHLEHRGDTVAFSFIGTEVPEGHQGTSVEGMSHGAVLSKLKSAFHRRRLPWGFNADHQPVGGKFDRREDALVRGCCLASCITFDISHELSAPTSHFDDENCILLLQLPSSHHHVSSLTSKVDLIAPTSVELLSGMNTISFS